MSDALDSALEKLREKVGDTKVDGSVKFDFTDLGALRLDEHGARKDDGAEADCTISASTEVFKAVFDGEMSPTAAFMSGKLRIAGDMGVAMRMAGLLG
jgi:putative sterol carrier protein